MSFPIVLRTVLGLFVLNACKGGINEDLMDSVIEGNARSVENLLKRGADANFKWKGVVLPLLAGAAFGQVDVVRVLLNHGAKPNMQTPQGVTPLMMAAAAGAIASEFFPGDRFANRFGNEQARTEVARLLLTHRANIGLRDAKGGTVLLLAAAEGNAILVQELLSRGANVNLPSFDGTTPLWAASIKGDAPTVKVLLARDRPTFR